MAMIFKGVFCSDVKTPIYGKDPFLETKVPRTRLGYWLGSAEASADPLEHLRTTPRPR
jgi:hypothetical protein